MTPRAAVVVSRQWHAPEISIAITAEGISVAMPLDDFLAALCTEAGSPLWRLTVAQQARALDAAAVRVIDGMKAETARVM